MKKILTTFLLLWLVIPVDVKSDTLYTIEDQAGNIHVQFVNVIPDSIYAIDFIRIGNLYFAKIERLPVDPDGWCIDLQLQRQDSSGWWYGVDTTICEPPRVYDMVAIEQQPDVDCSGSNDISDLMWLIDYMF